MEPYLGEIRLMAFAFDTADGWLLCDGRILQIRQYTALYSLLSTRYGGDGVNTFAIPDLRGRVGLHVTPPYTLGSKGGAESVALTANTMPLHTHSFFASSENADKTAVGTASSRVLATSSANLYAPAGNLVAMDDNLSSTGNGEAHANMQPSQVVAYCIASMGIYPPRQ